jgi:putative membrane protein
MMANEERKTANVLAGERTDLAVERTVMGANRTLMAWVRTALSMISFGFTIYKLLQGAAEAEEKARVLVTMRDPRRIGLTLIALGTASVILGTIEYFGTIKRLNQQSEYKYKPYNFSLVVGIVIGLLGLFLSITILTGTEMF